MPEDLSSCDDLTLASRCAAREEAAWEELIRRSGAAEQAVRRLFVRAGMPDPEAETEEVMAALVAALLENGGARLKAYRPPVPLWAYLMVIARNLALNVLRRRRPLALEAAGDLGWVPAESPVDSERLSQAMERLEPRQRLLLQLVYWEGLGHDEVAPLLGLEPGSVGPLMTRTREALRKLLSE